VLVDFLHLLDDDFRRGRTLRENTQNLNPHGCLQPHSEHAVARKVSMRLVARWLPAYDPNQWCMGLLSINFIDKDSPMNSHVLRFDCVQLHQKMKSYAEGARPCYGHGAPGFLVVQALFSVQNGTCIPSTLIDLYSLQSI
jgi:hypothetical protein